MKKETFIRGLLEQSYTEQNNLYVDKLSDTGYWSNLSKSDNQALIKKAEETSAADAVKNLQPELHDIIFERGRDAGLELLKLNGDEVCADFGCMWGALSIPLAKRARMVVGVDQTTYSLKLLLARLRDEHIDNVCLVNDDLKRFPVLDNGDVLDVAVVNGVLEWVPEIGEIELKKYYGKRAEKSYGNDHNPENIQRDFLVKVYRNLKQGGQLYLAIENRYDFKMFFGGKDPHANLYFTTILPKKVANWISWKFLGRPYVTWVYSKTELVALVKSAGFSNVDVYCAFPDYRLPKRIQHYKKSLGGYRPVSSMRDDKGDLSMRRVARFVIEYLMFGILRLRFLSPSFILIAKK